MRGRRRLDNGFTLATLISMDQIRAQYTGAEPTAASAISVSCWWFNGADGAGAVGGGAGCSSCCCVGGAIDSGSGCVIAGMVVKASSAILGMWTAVFTSSDESAGAGETSALWRNVGA